MLFAVLLNLPRGVNLHEIQYEHDSFLHNSKTYISPSLDVMVRAVGTSRLLTIFYILCLAITWISTEMKFEDIKHISMSSTFSFTYIISYGTQSIHHHITPQTIINEVIYAAWSKIIPIHPKHLLWEAIRSLTDLKDPSH